MKNVIPSGAIIPERNDCGVEESPGRRDRQRFLDSANRRFATICFAQNDNFKKLFFVFSLILIVCFGCTSSRPVPIQNSNVVATFATQKALHHFTDATALAVDQFGNAYVVETSANSVIKISPNGDSLHEAKGFGDDHYQFNGPCYVDARLSNAIFIADRFNHRIEQYTKDLVYSGTLYTRDNADPNKRFGYPTAVAADDAGNIYVADGENKRVLEFRSDYLYLRTIGGYSQTMRPEAILSNPVGLAVDKDENLVVLDNGGTSIVEYDNLGNFIARVALGEKVAALSTWKDEIYAMIVDQNIMRLFRSGTLIEDGSWASGISDSMDHSPINGLFVLNGQGYILSRQALYQCIGAGKPILQQ